MYCLHCGTELPDDANYCYKCGKATRKTTECEESEETWEYCEIKSESVLCDGFLTTDEWVWFLAEARGPAGTYGVGQSPKFRVYQGFLRRSEEANAIHARFIEKLTQDGWEPTAERGEHWWRLQFRRRAKRDEAVVPPEEAAKWEYCQIRSRIARDSLLAGTTYVFWADAKAPRKEYVAGKSSEFRKQPKFDTQETRAAHDRLVKALQKDRWELLPKRGLHWYELRLRRKLAD